MPLRVRLHEGMATNQWRFEPVIWGGPSAPDAEKEEARAGGICFEVFASDTGEEVAGLVLDWLSEPDPLGATMAFSLVYFNAPKNAFPLWVASGRLVPQPGGAIISQLAITPDAPGFPMGLETAEDYKDKDGKIPDNWVPDGGITSGLLRKVPLGIVFAGVQALLGADDSKEMAEFLASISVDYPDFRMAIQETGGEPAEDAPRKRGGRPGIPDEHLREVALAYLELAGQRGVHALLSKKFNKGPDAIKDLIRAARRAGWLAPGQAGRRGAYPGPRMLEEKGGWAGISQVPQNEGEPPGKDPGGGRTELPGRADD